MKEKSTPISRLLVSDHRIQEINEAYDQSEYKLIAIEQQEKAEKERLIKRFIEVHGFTPEAARQRIEDIWSGKYKPRQAAIRKRKITLFVRMYCKIKWWMHLLRKWRYEQIIGCEVKHRDVP